MGVTQEKVNKIQIDHGIVYLNYGETGETELCPTRGGGNFVVTRNIRDIEYDGRQGKTKGTRVIDEENATLTVIVLDTAADTLKLALPGATLTLGKISNSDNGLIPAADYLANVTMFAKTVEGKYKKITLYNAMADNGLSFAATPKAEGTIELQFAAHWAVGGSQLYDIEEVNSITTTSSSSSQT